MSTIKTIQKEHNIILNNIMKKYTTHINRIHVLTAAIQIIQEKLESDTAKNIIKNTDRKTWHDSEEARRSEADRKILHDLAIKLTDATNELQLTRNHLAESEYNRAELQRRLKAAQR